MEVHRGSQEGGERNGRDDSGECTGVIGERNAAVANVVVEEQNDEDTLMEPYQMTNADNPPRAFRPDRSTRKSDVLSATIKEGEGWVEQPVPTEPSKASTDAERPSSVSIYSALSERK